MAEFIVSSATYEIPDGLRRARTSWKLGARFRTVLIGLALPVLLVGLWQLNSLHPVVSTQILPQPADVYAIARDMVADGELGEAMYYSLWRVALGFSLGGAFGIAVGLATGLFRKVEDYLLPTIRAICFVPTIGWLPFFMVVFGIGEGLKIAIIVKGCFQPLVLATMRGVREASDRYEDVVAVLELPRKDILLKVILPAALPHIIAGCRLSLGFAWIVLVTAEMLASAEGIGYVIAWARLQFQLDVLIVGIVLIGLSGWLLDLLTRFAERRIDGWYGHG